MSTKPETESDWIGYRCRLNCEVARGIFEESSKVPPGMMRGDYALYVLASAIKHLSEQVDDLRRQLEKKP